jgi:hypothetical protein
MTTIVLQFLDEAERILREEQGLLAIPNGLPTFNDIEQGRLATETNTVN